MRVAIVSEKVSEEISTPGSGFVELVSAGPADGSLATRLRAIRPHMVTIEAPSEDALAQARLALEDIRTGEQSYPLQLLVTGGRQHSVPGTMIVEVEPARDPESLSLRAARAFASSNSLPRVLYLDDDASQLGPSITGEPFANDAWIVPLYVPPELVSGHPRTWQLPENRLALEQLLCLATGRKSGPCVMLDIHLYHPRVAVGIATALLNWTNAVIQPMSAMEQLVEFAEPIRVLAEIFGASRMLPSGAKDELRRVTGTKLIALLTERDSELTAPPPAKSKLRWEHVDRGCEGLATLAWFEWNMPWELAGRGQDGRWGFKARPEAAGRPKGGYAWETTARLPEVPRGWLESGSPDLLGGSRRGSFVFPALAFPVTKHEVVGAMTSCLAALDPPGSIEQLIERASTGNLSIWVNANYERLGRLHPLSSVVNGMNERPVSPTPRAFEQFSSESSLRTALQRAAQAGIEILGLDNGKPIRHQDDIVLLMLLATQELLRAGQNGQTKAGAFAEAARYLDRLFTCIEDPLVHHWPATLRRNAAPLGPEEEANRAEHGGRRQREVQLLVALTFALM
jgi:hypothetical protein